MKLVILNCGLRQKAHVPNTSVKKDLQQRFPDRFKGIGRFPGEFHVTLNDDIQPVVHSARKLPIHLKDELIEELDRMQDLGVIKRVTDLEQTDWISYLAVSRKSNGKLRESVLRPQGLEQNKTPNTGRDNSQAKRCQGFFNMRTCVENNDDIYLALLCFRITPLASNLPSPTEILYRWKKAKE